MRTWKGLRAELYPSTSQSFILSVPLDAYQRGNKVYEVLSSQVKEQQGFKTWGIGMRAPRSSLPISLAHLETTPSLGWVTGCWQQEGGQGEVWVCSISESKGQELSPGGRQGHAHLRGDCPLCT